MFVINYPRKLLLILKMITSKSIVFRFAFRLLVIITSFIYKMLFNIKNQRSIRKTFCWVNNVNISHSKKKVHLICFIASDSK